MPGSGRGWRGREGPARAGGMSAACMGPVPTEEEAMKALGPKLEVVAGHSQMRLVTYVDLA